MTDVICLQNNHNNNFILVFLFYSITLQWVYWLTSEKDLMLSEKSSLGTSIILLLGNHRSTFVKGSQSTGIKTLRVEERGRRKKSSLLAFNLITHSSWSTCRPEVIFIHRVHRGQWNNQQGTSPSENNREAWGQTQVCRAERKQVKLKKRRLDDT